MTPKDKVQAVMNKLREAMTALQSLDEVPDTDHLIDYAGDGIYSALGYLETVCSRTPEVDQRERLEG